VRRFSSLIALKKELGDVISSMALDWKAHIVGSLASGWVHGVTPLNLDRVDLWLDQFFRLGGSNRWIGEGLLRALDFWLPNRQLLSLDLRSEILGRYERVCVNRSRPGKSGDFLSNILQKHIQNLIPGYPPIVDLRELCATPSAYGGCKKILFIEDGLFTATETTNCISALLGLPHPQGRKWSISPLTNAAPLREMEITMRFPVATTFGMKRLETFLNINKLANIDVKPAADGMLSNLTPEGIAAVAENRFFVQGEHLCPVSPEVHLKVMAFQNLAIWKSEERVDRAMKFCYDVGLQLFRQYLHWKGWTAWDEKRILHSGLGMYGLGLALAFGHSVPKASLPLFWMDGDVTIGKHSLRWQPLFPDAKA
jgi:hypothetical protein